MNSVKQNLSWNYYIYSVINLSNGHVMHETDDIEHAKLLLREYKKNFSNIKFAIQQQHFIAKFI